MSETDRAIADIHTRYVRILTLYSLYRLREHPAVVATGKRRELTNLIAQIEARDFPDCFAPDIAKTIASAVKIILEHDRTTP
jgi:hypothetical protein